MEEIAMVGNADVQSSGPGRAMQEVIRLGGVLELMATRSLFGLGTGRAAAVVVHWLDDDRGFPSRLR